MRENRCKGTNIHNLLRVLRQEGGKAREEECIGRLPDDFRTAVQYGAIVRGGWYPLHWYRTLHATAQAVGMGPAFPRTVGKLSAMGDLSGGIYAVFLRIVSPAFIISGAARLFNRYYELGSMAIAESRPGFVQAKFHECYGFDHNIWQDMLGGCEGALVAARASDVRVRIADAGGDGEDHATFEAYYREGRREG
jgi:hypothetical protein